MPDSTSPLPPEASPGLPLVLMRQRPSGYAITVPQPLSATCALCQFQRCADAIGLHRLRGGRQQSPGFGGMRRDDGWRGAVGYAYGDYRMRGEQIQRVGIEQQWKVGADGTAKNLHRGIGFAQAGADDDRGGLGQRGIG